MVDVEILNAITPTVGALIGIITLAAFLWNLSRRFTTFEIERKQLVDRNEERLKEIKERFDNYEKEMKELLGQRKLEFTNITHDMENQLRNEMQKIAGNHADKFENLQKQIDNKSSSIKDLQSNIDVVSTEVKGIPKAIEKLEEELRKLLDFTVDWNQRIEDLDKRTNDKVYQLVSDAKRELMGTMNMLINLGNKFGKDK